MNYFEKVKDLKITQFDTSSKDLKYLVSYGERYFEVNQALFDLLKILQESTSIEEACRQFSIRKQKRCTVDEMNRLLTEKLSIIFTSSLKDIKECGLIYNLKILNSDFTNKLSSYFKYLYISKLYVFVFFCNIALFSYFIFNYGDFISFSLNNLDLYTFIIVIILLLLSTFFHELGHVSACSYFGIKCGYIGLGIYINMIVFYADVSHIWSLKRKQRILVNLGGVYFQSIILLPCYFFFFNNYNYLLCYFILCSNLNILLVLNPFFKFDGYWIFSDMLGLPNLRQRCIEVVKYIVELFGKCRIIEKPQLLSIKLSLRYIALVYLVLSVVFFTFFFLYFLPKIIYCYFSELPEIYNILEKEINGGVIPFDLLYYLIPKTVLVALFLYYIGRQLMKLFKVFVSNIKYSLKSK